LELGAAMAIAKRLTTSRAAVSFIFASGDHQAREDEFASKSDEVTNPNHRLPYMHLQHILQSLVIAR